MRLLREFWFGEGRQGWRWLVLGLLMMGLFAGCGSGTEEEGPQSLGMTVRSQWATAATASSEYGQPMWSAARATGAPEVERCADDPRAWASAYGRGLEWLELEYEEPVYATEVRIYQNLGRGAIARVKLRDEAGGEHLVWEGTDTGEVCPGVLSVSFPRTEYLVFSVRVEVDESRTGFWNQIDAVELIGMR